VTRPITSSEQTALWQRCHRSAWRLETREVYDVPEEAEELARFRRGEPVDSASDEWVQHVTAATTAGKHLGRVHVIDRPLADYDRDSYLRFETEFYWLSVPAGEDVRIAVRSQHPELQRLRRDFWLFDAETSQPFATLMRYDDHGRFLCAGLAEPASDPEVIAACLADRDLAMRLAVPLGQHLTATNTK
jgi:hypothetical protein